MSSLLAPCPLCRSAVRMRRKSGTRGKVCPSRFYREQVVCACGVSGPIGRRPDSSIAAWNRLARRETE